jgi:TATA-binding protein-associated factor Taf7
MKFGQALSHSCTDKFQDDDDDDDDDEEEEEEQEEEEEEEEEDVDAVVLDTLMDLFLNLYKRHSPQQRRKHTIRNTCIL